MRKIFLIAPVLIYSLSLKAQQPQDELKAMIDSVIDIKYAAFKKANKDQNNKYYFDNIYLLKDDALNYMLSSGKFKAVNDHNHHYQKVISKGIFTWEILTLLNNDHFKVIIADFYITYKNHDYKFVFSDDSKSIFDYRCDQNTWRVTRH